MSKRKLLDTFKNNDPNLSQLDSLKDLLFTNSIPYKETAHIELPLQILQNQLQNQYIHTSVPQMVENTIQIQFTEICYTFKFKSKHLVTIDSDFTTNNYGEPYVTQENDLANAIQEWVTRMLNNSKKI